MSTALSDEKGRHPTLYVNSSIDFVTTKLHFPDFDSPPSIYYNNILKGRYEWGWIYSMTVFRLHNVHRMVFLVRNKKEKKKKKNSLPECDSGSDIMSPQ